MDGTTVATVEIYPTASPRGVRDVASYSSDKRGAKDAKLKSKTELTITISDGEDASTSLRSSSLSRTSSFRKSATPKSVGFAISNWKRFSMTGVSAPLLLSLETLLTEQRLVYGIDMFDELSDEDQRESEFLQSYSYKFEETALVIFNRKRELVIPAPRELYRIAVEAKADNVKTSPAKGQQYAAERHRRHQFVLATLSEDEQMCLSMLLSDQEGKFKTNMFDAMTDDDEAEVAALLAQGHKYDDITHMIFQRKYEPNNPVQLVHPMQQRFHPSHDYGHHGYRGRDDGSVHSATSHSAVSMASLHSLTSPRNLFQPMTPSPGTASSSSSASVATETLHGTTVTQNNPNTPPARPHRRPSHFHFNQTYAPYSSSNGSVYSVGSVSDASSTAPAFHMPATSSGLFFLPSSSSVPSGGSIASSLPGASAHVQSKPNMAAATPMQSPSVTASAPTSTRSSPAPLTKSASAPASVIRMWTNPMRSSARSGNTSAVGHGNGNLSAQSGVSSAASAPSSAGAASVASPSKLLTPSGIHAADVSALSMHIPFQTPGSMPF
eukprot:gene12013-13639_t